MSRKKPSGPLKKLEFMNEQEIGDFMTMAAHAVEIAAECSGVEKPLFALVVFNDPKVGQYVGNTSRENIVEALREAADRLEKRQDVHRSR